MILSNFHVESFFRSIVQKSIINHISELSGDIFLSGRWFRPNFHVESFLRSIVQKSHINHRSELSGDHFHQWAMYSSKFSCREFLEIYSTKEPHQSRKWAIWRLFFWVGDDFVQIFKFRVSRDLKYKRATSFTEVSNLETFFMSGRWFRPNFHVESFLRSIVQKSHINHRNELSGDHFHEWAMILSKFSCREFLEVYSTKEPHQSQKWAIWRPFSWVGDVSSKFSCLEFLEIYSTKEPHQSQKWAIWRPFSWVGDDFVQVFMSRVFEIYSTKEHHQSQKWAIWRHFLEWAMISSKFSCREFLEIYSTKEPHQSQKWAIWRPFSWVGGDFVQVFMSKVSWDL